jgi:hypothetical protein
MKAKITPWVINDSDIGVKIIIYLTWWYAVMVPKQKHDYMQWCCQIATGTLIHIDLGNACHALLEYASFMFDFHYIINKSKN